MTGNIVWKSDFRVRLRKAVDYFKKTYLKEDTIEYKKHVDNFEARWKPKAQSQVEIRILQREINKLKV